MVKILKDAARFQNTEQYSGLACKVQKIMIILKRMILQFFSKMITLPAFQCIFGSLLFKYSLYVIYNLQQI